MTKKKEPTYLPDDEWIQVPSYPKYHVTKEGNIRSWRKPSVGWLAKTGYYQVYVPGGKTNKKELVHRMVAEAFLGPCPKGITVNHKDGNRANNIVTNLEYVTQGQNIKHAYDIGLHKSIKGTCRIFTPSQIRYIITQYRNGKNMERLAEELNVWPTAIRLRIIRAKEDGSYYV